MGSPSARLDIDEKFRPWVDSGLEYLFIPGHSQRGAQGELGAPMEQTAQASNRQAPAPLQQGQPTQHPSVAQTSTRQQPNYQAGQSQNSQQHSQAATVPSPTQPNSTVSFPEPWNTFLSMVKARSPKVVCTYMELGLDLGGQPDPQRRSVLRNTLTNHLKWPPGTAAFWPMSALVDGALQPNRTMFWKGWQIWKTPYIVCFGDEALHNIHPQAQPGGTIYMLEKITIFVAPPLAQLVTMLPHEQQLSTELLSAVRI